MRHTDERKPDSAEKTVRDIRLVTNRTQNSYRFLQWARLATITQISRVIWERSVETISRERGSL